MSSGNGKNGAAESSFEFWLNGETVHVEGASPNTTLLDYLRARGLRGTKEGCAEGDCGACSVALVERDAHGVPRHRAVNSCLALLPMVAGREVVTVEGVGEASCPRAGHDGTAKAALHPVQRAMVERHGSQCGYCTPGFIVSMFEAYGRDDLRERWQVSDALCGNLCRCTGYRPIADAACAALCARPAPPAAEPGTTRQTDAPSLDYKTGLGRFLQPATLDELLTLHAQNPGATLLAGATELGLEVNKKFYRFETLISVVAVPELGRIERTADGWKIGAAVPLTRIEEALRADSEDSPLVEANAALLKMIRVFGARPIRNRATLGGNLVNASPIGDMAPVLLALGASVNLRSTAGGRTLPLDEFFTGYRKTALRADEVLCEVLVPTGSSSRQTLTPNFRHPERSEVRAQPKDLPPARGQIIPERTTTVQPAAPRLLLDSFKVSRRREMDISVVSACFRVELDAENRVLSARLAFGGVAATTTRARQTETALLGQPWTRETVDAVLPILAGEINPINDVRASAEYRRGLVISLFEKFFVLDGQPEFTLDRRPLAAPPELPADTPAPHESAVGHVTGTARYVDDTRPPQGLLETWPVCSPHARARIVRRDASAARQMPGVRAILLAEDVPGENDVGAVRKDEILLADKEISFHGQLVALVVGDSLEACRLAADAVKVEYEPLPPILTILDALDAESFHTAPHRIRRGDADAELARAEQTLSGEFAFGGQEHFYLEGQVAWAEPGEDGNMFVQSSTQHPSEIQAVVAHVLHIPRHKVVVQSPRMGGGFGGKETQGNTWAALAALAAHRTGQPVRVRLNRDQDMILTGKRHPFLSRYEVGFSPDGTLRAVRVELFADGGWSLDLSSAITDRALFHLDNAYYLPHVDFCGRAVKTNLASNTAFRGFGGPQGMLIIEHIVDHVARHLGLPPEAVRERNLYHGSGETNTTHYGQEIGDNRLQHIWHTLKASSDFNTRRAEIRAWNGNQLHHKRGLAITPVKFGISFTISHLNQAGAHVLIYQDGSVQVNHGGTEMGQGLHTKMLTVAARELGLPFDQVRVMQTRTDQVPNTSPTAASSGSDLNGQAVRAACVTLRDRLAPVAADLLGEPLEAAAQIVFAAGRVFHPARPERTLPFSEVAMKAYLARVSLAATGYYATPGIKYDHDKGRGTPFYYYACGAAACEVEVDGFTGAHRVRRVDILHDAGRSINPGVDRGQIEGAFTQGMGWLTCEELRWDREGRLLTHAPSTYKIPAFGDTPEDFRVTLLPNAAEDKVIHGSKAVGEPPLMLAISVREAIRDAVAAFGDGDRGVVDLPSPATGEAIFLSVRNRRSVEVLAPG